MNSLLREIESEEVIVYRNLKYNDALVSRCREIHGSFVEQGKLEGCFDADRWVGFSGIKRYGIDFTVDSQLYRSHAGSELGIMEEKLRNMLRCYAISCHGVYIFNTISRDKVNIIRGFLQRYGDKDFKISRADMVTVEDFLVFIDTSDRQITRILSNIRQAKRRGTGQRQLSPIINYLAMENEVNRIYGSNPPESVFRKWFPVYFWVNVTFILPLRATEMLLTPKECIYRKDGKVYLRVRRTNLKKGLRTVYYDVDKDYREHSYDVPDTVVARNIEKYIGLTRAQDRRFLFEYNEQMVNGLFPLASFNRLTKAFMEEYIIGNTRYDFVRHASGITEFEPVTAGDSRPIAMANLYFQGAGADICRQLADHENINTSSGYYANISETIWASSLFQIQRRMDYRHRHSQELFEQGQGQMVGTENSVCVSAKRAADREDLSDCIEQGHLADCMGCRYYRPAERELQDFLDSQKMKADESARRVAELMDKAMRIKKPGASIEEMFLSAQTEASRYRMGCNIKAEEEYREWQRHRNIQKTGC